MAQVSSLLQRAKEKAPKFKRPDMAQFVPPDAKDAVDRVVAAGHRLMYSPDMRDDLQQAVDAQEPVPQKLANNVSGLLLTLDGQARGGIPMAAIFPAAMELLGEAAEVLAAAGQPVTQEDFNEAARALFVVLGRKLGATDEQMMGAAQQATGGAGQAPEGQEPEGGETQAHEGAESPPEEAQEGMTEEEEA